MVKVFKFQQEDEICDCAYCEITKCAVNELLDAESQEELEDIIEDLVSDVRAITYQEAIIADVNNKIGLLGILIQENECSCEECCNGYCKK